MHAGPMSRLFLLTGLALTLGACNYLGGEEGMFRDRGGEYAQAQVVPDMQIPPELDSYTLDQLYVIPEPMNASLNTFEQIPLPRPIEERRREGVVIQSLNNKSWILIDATPGQVWPMVRDYWTELQIQLEYENPGQGLMETAWLEIGNDQTLRHKYRISIEPGLHSGFSEIYVTHLQQPRDEAIPTVVSWPETSDSPDLERQVMTSVSQYLADRNDIYQASSASLLAGSIEAASKANLVRNDSGKQVLELRIDYERAWVQVREALEEAQLEVTETNRDGSFFTVRFAGIIGEEDQPGFIGRLFRGSGDDNERLPRDFTVRLVRNDNSVTVITEPLESGPETAQLSTDLLQVINDNLG